MQYTIGMFRCYIEMNYLSKISCREDLLALNMNQTKQLCQEIRTFLIDNVSRTGGHIASNLGVVELTVAIHRVFDTSRDRLVFDVGHQSYVHKILTGRADRFSTLRQFQGLAGFPKPNESVNDAFIAGHASNSVSVALGMAKARTLLNEDYSVIALLGDGALTGGLAYEGLNNAGASREPLIVILNDNGMSITPNVGATARHLSNIRTRQSYFQIKKIWRNISGKTTAGRFLYRSVHRFKEYLKKKMIGSNVFYDMGFEYIGPVDGHDVEKLTYLLQVAKEMQCPVLLHVLTKKGKGYPHAEQNPDSFHGVGPFDVKTGIEQKLSQTTFSETFGKALADLAEKSPRICAITAAMQCGTGLNEFAKCFPDRFFDVGIAEGHAVSMAAGLAKQGMIPVVAIYSTFLQRAYDMLIHDVGLLNLHVVFAVDRAGLVGADGETHHGVFDVSYLSSIPGMQILCPANQAELTAMLRKAALEMEGPVAVRYPRGGDGRFCHPSDSPVLLEGDDLSICAYGTMINTALDTAELLNREGISAGVIKIDQILPIPDDIPKLAAKTGRVFVIEETMNHCGIFDSLASRPDMRGICMCTANLGDHFVPHGDVKHLYDLTGLTPEKLSEKACQFVAETRRAVHET